MGRNLLRSGPARSRPGRRCRKEEIAEGILSREEAASGRAFERGFARK